MNSNYIGKPMRCLFDEDHHDYDPKWKTKGRETARGIIIQGDQILIDHFGKDDFYALPGGGIDDNEPIVDALIREIKEESGYDVIRKSIRAYGCTSLARADYTEPETVYIGKDYVFTANVNLNTHITPELTNSEKRLKMSSFWVPLTSLKKIIPHNFKIAEKTKGMVSSGITTDAGFPLMKRYDAICRDTKILELFVKDMHL